MKISFIVLVSFALSGHSALAQTIVLHPSKAVVFCLKDNPRTVVLGDAKSFRASKIGPKQILLQGFVQGKTTNLVVLGKDQAVRSLPLVTDIGQPFLAKIECDPDLRPSPNQTEQRRSLPTVSDRSVRVAVTSLKWNAKTRDYLNLSFEVTNLTGRLIRMRWGELVLLSGEKKIPHSRLWAARRELPPGAKVLVRTEFKKPELAMFPVNILVLFDDLELRVPLKEEDLK